MRLITLFTIKIISLQTCLAYVDTTPKSFNKPKPIKSYAYKYHKSQFDKFIDTAADKVGGKVIGNIIGGPTGFVLNMGSKVFKDKEPAK